MFFFSTIYYDYKPTNKEKEGSKKINRSKREREREREKNK
jgi:hypothetical protein